MIDEIAICSVIEPTWLLFSENVPPLIYYSHLPIALLALLIGSYVCFQTKKSRTGNVLFYTLLSFALWVILDSIFWASNRSDTIMFVWSVILIIEPIVYIGSFYLIYVLIKNKDLPFKGKIVFGLLFLPLIILEANPFSTRDCNTR